MYQKEKTQLDEILSPISDHIIKTNKKLLENLSKENQTIREIAKYAVFSNGKRLRPAFVFLFAKMVNSDITYKHYLLAQVTELIHVASTIHDDVVDNSPTRHHQPSVFKQWGIKEAIISGDFLLAKAMTLLSQIENSKLISMFSKITEELCSGELQQLMQTNNTPTLDEIVEKSKRKTAMLYIAAAKGSLFVSDADEQAQSAAEEYAKNFGIAYQITDDLLAYKDDYEEKSQFSDFENKIFTPVSFFACEENPKIMLMTSYEEFQNEIKKTNALEKTNLLAGQYINRAIDSLSFFEDNIAKQTIINLTNYIKERTI